MVNHSATDQTILIIDSDTVTVELISNLYNKAVSVLRALTVDAGLKIAASEQPDLIILDAFPPSFIGFETCRQLKNLPATKHIPLIFCSHSNQNGEELRALQLGALHFVSKPFSPDILKAVITNNLSFKKYQNQLEMLSTFDSLTGISNRRRFDEYLILEWRRARRNKYSLSLLMIDIDHFKQYNDSFGHQKGDEAIQAVAEEIQKHLRRPSDMVARYGGEEFSVILPETPPEAALDLANRIWCGIGALEMDTTVDQKGLTVSIGVATITPGNENGWQELVQVADSNLYKSKESGRNQITN
ncbi:MAG: diguanylate cyclase [Pseudomonadota bacterium]|nr:diguanylate cyclase [Pseudomonadota bacterium]